MKSINDVKSQFRVWRKSKKSEGSITPLGLREAALAIKEQYGCYVAQRALSLSGASLRRWALDASKNKKSKPAKRKQCPNFIELMPRASPEVPGLQSEALIEANCGVLVQWQRADGAQLRVSGSRLGESQINHWIQRFLDAPQKEVRS